MRNKLAITDKMIRGGGVDLGVTVEGREWILGRIFKGLLNSKLAAAVQSREKEKKVGWVWPSRGQGGYGWHWRWRWRWRWLACAQKAG